MKHSSLAATLLFLAFASQSPAQIVEHQSQPTYTLEDQNTFKQGNNILSAKIEMPQTVDRNTDITLHTQFLNDGPDITLYNINFHRLISSPAGILLFDAKKQFVTDLFDFDQFNGSHRTIESDDWTTVRSQSTSKIDLLFNIPTQIPPGKYSIQLVYWKLLLATPPMKDNAIPRKATRYLRQPLFRSNILPIEVR